MSRAFLVLGPESSGTRLLTRVLISAGCLGNDGHEQVFDLGLPAPNGTPIVWRRSVPHRHTPLDLPALLRSLAGYDVSAVITTRDWRAMAQSQVAAPHASSLEQARAQISEAYLSIFSQLKDTRLPFTVASYESLVLHPERAQRALLDELGLPAPSNLVAVSDENEKWLR